MFRMNSNLTRRRGAFCYPMTSASPSGAVGTGDITITSPVSYQVFQQNDAGIGSIAITGTYTGSPGRIEGSFNGGDWSVFQIEPTGGIFSGVLTGQAAGQGTLSVRWLGNPTSVQTISLISVGDIFVIAGQSNGVGMTSGNQSYSHATLKPGLFGNDYNWKELADPVDSNTNQVDTVSSDACGGSYYPILATTYMTSTGGPCGFIPCAKIGSLISQWQPGANHQDRSTLYGSMCYRINQAGGAKVILWWQGESDVINETTQAAYNAALDTLANSIYADTGVKMMVCKLEDMANAGVWGGDESTINAAIGEAWSDNDNVIPGPDLAAVWGPVDAIHYTSAEAPSINGYWWAALQAAFGWS